MLLRATAQLFSRMKAEGVCSRPASASSGAAGVSQDSPLAYLYAHVRTLRLADGPDEVHKLSIARREIRRHAEADEGDRREGLVESTSRS